jgi:molybdopterin-containing oxidoreductase family membrane subunit
MQPKNDHEAIILEPVRRITRTDVLLWVISGGLLFLGFATWLRQYILGLGVTGLNRPVYWGIYLTNFVFFIGLAHSGTFISAILRVAGQSWRAPLTRAAEAITLFSLPFGVASILIDMGRPERLFNLVFFGRYQSPLLWDVTAVMLYFISSYVFFYLSMLPDLAICRDRLTDATPIRKKMYTLLALGWQHHPEQYHRLERVLDGMAIFMTMLVVTVHTVVSWAFSMTLQPGWHTALLGPFFLLGAILSGTAAVVITLALLRKFYKLEAILPLSVFNSLRKLLITFILGWLYFMIAEYLTIGYGNMTEEMRVFEGKFSGDFSIMFWYMSILVFLIPLLLLIFKGKNSIGWMVTSSILINIGMWMERYIVIIPSEIYPRLLHLFGEGTYIPTWTEIIITISLFAGLFFIYAVFTRFFPIIPIWETAEEIPHLEKTTEPASTPAGD